jgi:hypothetical protein
MFRNTKKAHALLAVLAHNQSCYELIDSSGLSFYFERSVGRYLSVRAIIFIFIFIFCGSMRAII